uniref:Uncharacterized protein n=1 Tax=Caenorhabditis tropicalis TaxID=1561998 RepID=A0A1I7TZJ3_9PELO
MMTGYGYNPNLVQQPVHQGVNDNWGQTAGQSQYYTESGNTAWANPMFDGFSAWSHAPPVYNYPQDGDFIGQHNQEDMTPFAAHNHLMSTTSSAPPPQPKVSISDAELYQALNMSPIPTASTAYYAQQSHQPQAQPMTQMPTIQAHPQIDYLSEVCFPSTSTFDPMSYNQSYIPPPSSIPPEDPHNYGHDGDDEESFGEPERYETMSPTFSIHSFAPTTSTNTAEAEDLEVELINNHKPTPRYRMADDIDIFLHTGTTDDTEYNDESDSRVGIGTQCDLYADRDDEM